jgi:hypothetical protein
MGFKSATTTIFALAILAAGPAAAGDFYYGAGLGYTHAKSGSGSFGTAASNADLSMLGLTLGYRVNRAKVFFAGELDGEVNLGGKFHDDVSGNTCASGAGGPYYCSHDSTLRLRGIVGTQLNNDYEIFGSLGVVQVRGKSAVGPVTQDSVRSTGFTIGIGAQRKMPKYGVGRLELIYDKANSSNNPGGYDPKYQAVTLKASWLF